MSRVRSRGDLEGDARARAFTRVRDFLPTLTQASGAMDCDINVLAKRFGIGEGAMPPAAVDASYYGDFDMSLTLGEAMERVRSASEHFAKLPVAIRSRFDNSPALLWAFLNDAANVDEAVSMGLLMRRSASAGRSVAEPPPGSPPAPSGAGSAVGA